VQDARRSQLTRKGRRTVIGGVQIEDSCQSRMAGHGASFDMFAKGNANRNECSQVPGHLSGHVLGRVLSPSDLPVVADALASLLLCHDCPCHDANLASQEQELLTSFAVLVDPALPSASAATAGATLGCQAARLINSCSPSSLCFSSSTQYGLFQGLPMYSLCKTRSNPLRPLS
jgi:hypothetical protein